MRTLALASFAMFACSHTDPYYRDPQRAPPEYGDESIELRIVLTGDTGSADSPLIRELGSFLSEHDVPTHLLLLGGNLHPRGCAILNPKGVSRILVQTVSFTSTASTVSFIPGSDDWDHRSRSDSFEDGICKVASEERFLESPKRRKRATWAPDAGCPGPTVVRTRPVKIIALDSEWWFQDRQSRETWAKSQKCAQHSEDEVSSALQRELACSEGDRCAPRILVAHHPLASYGEHGGSFSFAWHFIPIAGSLYVLARNLGASAEDISSDEYQNFRKRLLEAINAAPPLLIAAAHDPNLQVLDGPVAHRTVVSGAGTESGHVGHGDDTRFALEDRGFMTVDVLKDGRIGLRVYAERGKHAIEAPIYGELLKE